MDINTFYEIFDEAVTKVAGGKYRYINVHVIFVVKPGFKIDKNMSSLQGRCRWH